MRATNLIGWTMKSKDHGAGSGSIGALLRHWRARRGMSQLALSLDSGLSQRHPSFVESGRAMPSRAAILTLAHEIRLESMFPLDAATEARHLALFGS
jgi:transcriptional regulator with XRE-family HTH domain